MQSAAPAFTLSSVHEIFEELVLETPLPPQYSFDDLRGRVVLITGASSGIGAAAALAFGGCSAHVAVHYRNRQAEAVALAGRIRESGGEAETFQADVSDTASLDRLAAATAARFGRIDILVNNAGGFIRRVALADADDAIVDEIFHQNARSMVALSRRVIPMMRAQGGGVIINVTSQAARSGGSFGSGLYSSTKGFVSTYTRALAKELAAEGIRVNAVSPGVIDTPIHEGHTSAALLESLRTGIPMRRLGRADECSGAFLFLASERLSSYITGQIIEVNGGSVMP
jgi:3-oxoacyl-[acyl-carrier protein] reductase